MWICMSEKGIWSTFLETFMWRLDADKYHPRKNMRCQRDQNSTTWALLFTRLKLVQKPGSDQPPPQPLSFGGRNWIIPIRETNVPILGYRIKSAHNSAKINMTQWQYCCHSLSIISVPCFTKCCFIQSSQQAHELGTESVRTLPVTVMGNSPQTDSYYKGIFKLGMSIKNPDPVAPKMSPKPEILSFSSLLSCWLSFWASGSQSREFQAFPWWQNGCCCSRPHIFIPHPTEKERASPGIHSLSLVPNELCVCPWANISAVEERRGGCGKKDWLDLAFGVREWPTPRNQWCSQS